jgi:ribosomal protein S6--L-glutamate ligase
MEKIKIAIIGPDTDNTFDLIEAANKRIFAAESFLFKDIEIEMCADDVVAHIGEKNILDFDIVFFRGYNNHIHEAQMLASMLVENKKIVIEQSLAGKYIHGKMQQAHMFNSMKVPHPKTVHAFSLDGWKNVLSDFDFPIIIKPVFGFKGRGVVKIETFKEALSFFEKNNEVEYLAQEYFPIESDYRIFVVGGKIIGGFRRDLFEGEYKSNVHGTPAENIVIDKEMARISLAAAEAVGYEITGIDLMRFGNEIYVIEANVVPQWEKFKKVTGINPAEAIMDYAIEKYKNR